MLRKFLTILIIMSTAMFLGLGCDGGGSGGGDDEVPVSEDYILTAEGMTSTMNGLEPLLGTLRADYITLDVSNTTMTGMKVEPIGFTADEFVIPEQILYIKEIQMTHAAGDKKGNVVDIHIGMSAIFLAEYLYMIDSTDTFTDVRIVLVALKINGVANGTNLTIDVCDRLVIDDPSDIYTIGQPGFLWQTASDGDIYDSMLSSEVQKSNCSTDFPVEDCPGGDWACPDAPWTNPAKVHDVWGHASFDNVVQSITAIKSKVIGDYKYSGNFTMTAPNIRFDGTSKFDLYRLYFDMKLGASTQTIDRYGWNTWGLDLIQVNLQNTEFGLYGINASNFQFTDYKMISPSAEKLGIEL